MIRISILLILFLALIGCFGTKAGAYRVFAEDLERLVGTNFQYSFVYNIGHLSKLPPDKIEELGGGSVIKTFEVKPPRKQDCKVHIEIDSSNTIVGATSEGAECWRAY